MLARGVVLDHVAYSKREIQGINLVQESLGLLVEQLLVHRKKTVSLLAHQSYIVSTPRPYSNKVAEGGG